MHTVKWNRSRACDKVCHHHQTGLLCATSTVRESSVGVVHKNMPYDGVQVYIRNNSSVCTSAGDCVSQHGCIMRELKIVNTCTTDVIASVAEWA